MSACLLQNSECADALPCPPQPIMAIFAREFAPLTFSASAEGRIIIEPNAAEAFRKSLRFIIAYLLLVDTILYSAVAPSNKMPNPAPLIAPQVKILQKNCRRRKNLRASKIPPAKKKNATSGNTEYQLRRSVPTNLIKRRNARARHRERLRPKPRPSQHPIPQTLRTP